MLLLETAIFYLLFGLVVAVAHYLRGGAAVTDTCFAVGFGSLSHFVTTFRRRFGVRPSALRRGATAGP